MMQHQEAGAVAPAEAAAEAAAPAASRRRGSRWRAVRQAASLYGLVALGSMIGGVLRAIASLGIHAHMEAGFPWGTLFVNVTGSFAIGFYATLTGPEGRLLVGSRQRQFVMTGICGGYTTFSVFRYERQGYLAMGGQIVDASIVRVPKQRNSRDDNAKIKAGETPAGWAKQPAKRAQKDTDARWTKKHGRSHSATRTTSTWIGGTSWSGATR